jgi:hypothetical protein
MMYGVHHMLSGSFRVILQRPDWVAVGGDNDGLVGQMGPLGLESDQDGLELVDINVKY